MNATVGGPRIRAFKGSISLSDSVAGYSRILSLQEAVLLLQDAAKAVENVYLNGTIPKAKPEEQP